MNQAAQNWQPDVLGEPFVSRVLPLSDGQRATLVRYRPPQPPGGPRRFSLFHPVPRAPLESVAVLAVHGWSDYFFQRELAEFFGATGAAFYAVDLRNYGRNLVPTPGEPALEPGYIDNLSHYAEEFDAALAIIKAEHPDAQRVLLGHSTGGLSAALYAAEHPRAVDALVLNSPWLEFQATSYGREALKPLIDAGSFVNPHRILPGMDPGIYTRTVNAAQDGEWDYNLAWRPAQGFPLTTGFISAVLAGQEKLAHGLDLPIPVHVLLSARDYLAPRWDVRALSADTALNVRAVAQRALDLGPRLTISRFDGALHDIFLSRRPVRTEAYTVTAGWLADVLASGRAERFAGLARDVTNNN
ncbi:alpha/beta hydrolase [Glutamicibacter endophyticus]